MKLHNFTIKNVSCKKISYQMGRKQANIYHQAWLDLYPKCHSSIETSSKQSLRQITSNCKHYLRDYLGSPWVAFVQR
jgi:hypothetical protein